MVKGIRAFSGLECGTLCDRSVCDEWEPRRRGASSEAGIVVYAEYNTAVEVTEKSEMTPVTAPFLP